MHNKKCIVCPDSFILNPYHLLCLRAIYNTHDKIFSKKRFANSLINLTLPYNLNA